MRRSFWQEWGGVAVFAIAGVGIALSIIEATTVEVGPHPRGPLRAAEQAAAAAPAPPAEPEPLTAEELEAAAWRIGDTYAPFPWREHVHHIEIGCRELPGMECPAGVAEYATDTIHIAPHVGALTENQIEAVVMHEIAHFWQKQHTGERLFGEYTVDGVDSMELEADCLAAAWTGDRIGGGYWRCPTQLVEAAAAISMSGDGPLTGAGADGP